MVIYTAHIFKRESLQGRGPTVPWRNPRPGVGEALAMVYNKLSPLSTQRTSDSVQRRLVSMMNPCMYQVYIPEEVVDSQP